MIVHSKTSPTTVSKYFVMSFSNSRPQSPENNGNSSATDWHEMKDAFRSTSIKLSEQLASLLETTSPMESITLLARFHVLLHTHMLPLSKEVTDHQSYLSAANTRHHREVSIDDQQQV
jgi:chromatin remodeling complex protein RSC6